MNNITEVKNEVIRIISEIDSNAIFIRANDPEANQKSTYTDFENNLFVQMSDPEGANGTYQEKIYSLAIRFLYLNGSNDDTQDEKDLLINQAETKAKEFFNKILQSPLKGAFTPIEDYDLEYIEAQNVHESIFTGVDFAMDFPVSSYNYIPC